MMNSDHHIHHLDNTQMRNLKRAGSLNCLTGNMILLLPIENPGRLAQETTTEVLKNTRCWAHCLNSSVRSQKSKRRTRQVYSANHLVRKVWSWVPCLVVSKTACQQETIVPNDQNQLWSVSSLHMNGLTTPLHHHQYSMGWDLLDPHFLKKGSPKERLE